jgi:DNA replication and repair protein RecF
LAGEVSSETALPGFMGISKLEINNIRNLQSVKLEPSPGINGFCGINGSGKTAILEAIHLLGRGTSFRARDVKRVLQEGAARFSVSARLQPLNIPIGIEYQQRAIHFRVGGQAARSRLDLVNRLPLLFISPESHALVSQGPQERRRFLDWGVFHVEPRFLPAWRRYQRALKQRNKALGSPGVEEAWDHELVQAGEEITRLRIAYLAQLVIYANQYAALLSAVDELKLLFSCGWRQDMDFMSVLRATLPQDRGYGFTGQGPHRADIHVKVGNRLVRDSVSRGQQKLVVIAMLLAQAALLNVTTAQKPVILVDDVAAELDIYHRRRLLEVLSDLRAQVFLTVTEQQTLPRDDIPIQWFHVEQGRVGQSQRREI